jgi:hypothetical protein
MESSLVKRSTIEAVAESEPPWVRLLTPRSAEEVQRARRIAVASRHIWAFRLAFTVAERMAWYRAWGMVQ